MAAAFTLQGCNSDWSVPGAASNLLPAVVITSPFAGSISDEGTNITFTGSANDPEDGALSGSSLVWTSDRDGQIGTGLTFDITTLSRGVHVITLTAADESRATGTASITITVRTPWLVDTSWGFRQRITISSAMVPSDQGDFPALIKITDQTNPLFGNALSNGDDILFTDVDGVNKSDHEIELYLDAGTMELDAWVRIPNLSSTSDTILYMYYGNGGAINQENPTGVWDNNYLGVWHLEEDPSFSSDCAGGAGTKEICDSTSNDLDGDSLGGMTSGDQVPGQIDGSLDFDYVNDYVNFGDVIDLTQNITVEAWFNARSLPPVWPEWRSIVGEIWDWQVEFSDSGSVMFRRWQPYQMLQSAAVLSLDQWYYVAFTLAINNPLDVNNKNLKIYVNGVFDNEGPIQTPLQTRAYSLAIARRIQSDIDRFDGFIDEVRISDTVRSAEWIGASYKNQNDPGTGNPLDPDVYTTFAAEELL
ncbi:MAG TPA: DUF2341 domain-containing protein [Nitrospirae bacterium]|nr:hypothetical protein BMS3Abin10_00344 [bacterium BMS3Abin10]GBE40106.1 hypothetical protein BMS3Bbin08_02744 [bacterium BMS3Bbin08]HDH50765.1 DUF2341 domain-containing protein [Nitrospirota bacterium]HDO25956.1 DUF2341 domain-containing protein [Nitrospirota bacterium]HDZ84543.1 DUF2341 domain-containing protein [Nitrospirota bacterium]